MDELLSEYTIKETIGKGTFSVVKLGINKTTKEKVAIKILKKNKIIHREDVERIEREISILKKLLNECLICNSSNNFIDFINTRLFIFIEKRKFL